MLSQASLWFSFSYCCCLVSSQLVTVLKGTLDSPDLSISSLASLAVVTFLPSQSSQHMVDSLLPDQGQHMVDSLLPDQGQHKVAQVDVLQPVQGQHMVMSHFLALYLAVKQMLDSL